MPTDTKNISEHSTQTRQHRRSLKTTALRAYTDQKNSADTDKLITEQLPMVYKIVHRVASYLRPPLSFEDMVSAGTIGLVKAARDYRPCHNARFQTYAYIRIKGAILDELRARTFVPAGMNKQIRNITETSQRITAKTGTVPTDEQLAEKLEMTVEQLYKIQENARTKSFLSLDGNTENENSVSLSNLLTSANSQTPYETMQHSELIDKLSEAIEQLPDRQRQIIVLYYQQNLTMKQTAEVFNITESRVSQLHASALFNLSSKLRQYQDGR